MMEMIDELTMDQYENLHELYSVFEFEWIQEYLESVLKSLDDNDENKTLFKNMLDDVNRNNSDTCFKVDFDGLTVNSISKDELKEILQDNEINDD